VAEREKLKPEEPAALCQALETLGLIYHSQGRSDKALERYQEAVDLSRRWYGKDRGTTGEDVAAALESLSSLLPDLGNFPGALDAIGESLSRRRHAVPFLPEKVVAALTTRARIEERLDLKTSRDTLLEAHRLSQSLGPGHSPEASRVANNLGYVLYRLGDFTQAISLLQEAERLRKHDPASGEAERRLASTQLNLGQVFYDLGDYPQAIEYYGKAVKGHFDWLAEDPYRYCDAISARARVMEESGQWDDALALQREALAIREGAVRSTMPKPDQPADPELQLMLARSLTHLGALQQRMGAPEARASLERALAIEDKSVPADRADIDRAETLVELADYWRQAGDPQRARKLIARSLKELSTLREGGSLVIHATEVSAQVAIDPVDGLKALAQVDRLVRRLYGDGSAGTASVLQVRAGLRHRQGDVAGALDDALLSQRISLPHIRSIVQAFPRDQALVFAADRRQSLDLALELVAKTPGLKAETVNQVFQTAANSRMLVRDAEVERQRLLYAVKDPHLAQIAKRLASARERFAFLLVQTQGTIGTQADRLREARRELLEAEASLATKTRRLLASSAVAETSVSRVRKRLLPGYALVAIHRYRQAAGTEAYVAFIVNGSNPIRTASLGEAAAVDGLIKQWREAILSSRSSAEYRTQAGQALRRTIWDPIARWLDDTRSVLVVPDGALYTVPLMALPAQDGKYLIQHDWAFHILTAERELFNEPPSSEAGPWLALAVGDVDYYRSAAPAITAIVSSPELLRGAELSKPDPDSTRAGECRREGLSLFSSLPGSKAEVQDLASLWEQLRRSSPNRTFDLVELTGPDATEQGLRKAVAGKRVVHLATHGFATAEGCASSRSAARGIGGLSLGSGVSTQPRLAAGLAFAGANDRRKAVRSDQDGILTEEEILDLDLRKADWVVLSACESGLGKTSSGEGVVGLLRAFQVAGAKSVIVSLWPVEDKAAQRWMHDLYQARFGQARSGRHLSTMESMRQAALSSLNYYSKQGNDNPVKWAGFVASGQWK